MKHTEYDWMKPILSNRSELSPIDSGVPDELRALDGIRAVIFDIYGTLVISGSGDVGTVNDADRGTQIDKSLSAAEIAPAPDITLDRLREIISQENDARRGPECPKPEVDIVSVWDRLLSESSHDSSSSSLSIESVVRVAAEYESLSNPTWPMPGARELLCKLNAADLKLGIVSNAQVFTLLLVDELDGRNGGSTAESGALLGENPIFDRNLCIFSNRYRQAKPGPRLFEVLCGELGRAGIHPSEAVYVGNDMLNDVWAASQAGLKTAWFAGDRRSCRDRQNDSRCQGLRPDVVLTSLLQLINCLDIQ